MLKELFTFLTYIGLSIFHSLNLCFLANPELITSPVAPLSNSASTVTLFCISTLFNPILTVTSLSLSSLFRSQQDILSITLENIVYILLRLNQEVLSLCSHLNFLVHFLLQPSSVYCSYYRYILVFYLLQFCSLYSYSSLPNI